MKVVAWNLHQAVDRRPDNVAKTWAYLRDELSPTVALIQEASVVPETPGGHVATIAPPGYQTAVIGFAAAVRPIGEVVTRYSKHHTFTITPMVSGIFAAAQVADPPDGVPFIAISLYGLMAPVYAQVAVLRAVADLIPLFDTPSLNRRIVVGGDLNLYDQSRDRIERGRWQAILRVLESLGLVNLLRHTQSVRGPLVGCPCGNDDCWHVETFRPHKRRRDGTAGYFTNDYLFATPELADRLLSLEIPNRPELWALSDHLPLVASFDLQ
jgi:hypothetical protein